VVGGVLRGAAAAPHRLEGPGRSASYAATRWPYSIDVTGLDLSLEALETALAVDADEWKAEVPLIEEWFAKIGDKLPESLRVELDTLKSRLSEQA
jgi:phosphoenolpyruvate carboxykinase (GTP)